MASGHRGDEPFAVPFGDRVDHVAGHLVRFVGVEDPHQVEEVGRLQDGELLPEHLDLGGLDALLVVRDLQLGAGFGRWHGRARYQVDLR